MKFRVVIDVDNDAFVNEDDGRPDPGPEVARILRKLADRVKDEFIEVDVPLKDGNGNTVGRATYTRR